MKPAQITGVQMADPLNFPKRRNEPPEPAAEVMYATLRDRFAMAALQGMLASNGADWDIGPDKLFTAQECYQYADAMIKARRKQT